MVRCLWYFGLCTRVYVYTCDLDSLLGRGNACWKVFLMCDGGLLGYRLRAVIFSAPHTKEMSLHTQLSTVWVAANCTRLSVG